MSTHPDPYAHLPIFERVAARARDIAAAAADLASINPLERTAVAGERLPDVPSSCYPQGSIALPAGHGKTLDDGEASALLPCRSMAIVASTGFTCSGTEGHGGRHTADVAAEYTATETKGRDRRGATRVRVTWDAPVVGTDMRIDGGELE